MHRPHFAIASIMFSTDYPSPTAMEPAPLRIHAPDPPCPFEESLGKYLPSFTSMNDAFQKATGWSLTYHEIPSSRRQRILARCPGMPIRGELVIDDLSPNWPVGKSAASRRHCDTLINSLNQLLSQLDDERRQNWERSAELASSIPVGVKQSPEWFAAKLTAMIQQAVGHLQVDGGYLYVIDAFGRELRLCSQAGCFESSPDSTKRLDDSPMDLMAIKDGKAIVDSQSRVDKALPSGHGKSRMCVSVSGDSGDLGTLWFVSGSDSKVFEKRDVQYAQVTAELIAGLLARRVMQREIQFLKTNRLTFGTDVATRPMPISSDVPSLQLASVNVLPLLPPSEKCAIQWQVDSQNRLNVAMFSIVSQHYSSTHVSVVNALVVAKTAMQCLSKQQKAAGELLTDINDAIYQAFLGDIELAAWLIQIDSVSGAFEVSGSGDFLCWQTRATGAVPINSSTNLIGGTPQQEFGVLAGYLPRKEHLATFWLNQSEPEFGDAESVQQVLNSTVEGFTRQIPESCQTAFEQQIMQRIPRMNQLPTNGLLISRI